MYGVKTLDGVSAAPISTADASAFIDDLLEEKRLSTLTDFALRTDDLAAAFRHV